MNRDQDNAAIVGRILAGARWATAFRLIAQIISWTSTIVVVRYISKSDYGLNAMLEAPLELLFLLSTFGLDTALVRSKKLDEAQIRSVFGWLLLVNGGLFLSYFFGGALLAAYFKEPRLDELAQVLAFIFLLVPLRVIPNALLDRELKFKLKATTELVASVITSIVMLVLAMLGFGIWALVTGMLLSRVLLVLMLMVLQPWFLIPSLRFAPARSMLAFGGTMALASAIAMSSNALPALIAGPAMGAELLGVFVVALQFALLPLSKIMPVINPIIFPAFSKFQEQRGVVTHYFEKALGIAGLTLLPIMVGTACVADAFVLTLLGETWRPAVLPLALLSLAMPMRGATSFVRQVMGSIGHADLALKSTAIAFAIFLPLVLMSRGHGLMGLVAAVLIVEPLVLLLTLQMSKRAFDTSLAKIARVLAPSLVSSAIMALCIFAVAFFVGTTNTLIQLLIEVGVGAASYLLTLRLFFSTQFGGAIALLTGKKPA